MARLAVYAMTRKGHAVTTLLAERYRDLVAHVTIGRDGQIETDFSDEIAALCEDAGIPFGFRGDGAPVEADFALAVSWRWMIERDPERLIVLHDSLLPRYRGFAPLPNALINGEPRIGVTALFGAADYDRGAILHQEASDIAYPITIAEAIEINNRNYLAAAAAVLDRLRAGEPLVGTPQREEDATYSIWRDAGDYRIDWSQSAGAIRRFVDALGSPYAGALTHDGTRDIRILKVEPVPDEVCELRHAGKVLRIDEGCPVVICGEGLLRIVDARSDEDGRSCLPLARFRTRFR